MFKLEYKNPFPLECGDVLDKIDITYYTYGQLNKQQNNVIWICHALTGNADAADWWSGAVGEGKIFDPNKYFIICSNVLGSCYGATNANSINPKTGKRYGKDFPIITIRDMVHSHQILQKHLGIERIKLCIGGSVGGQQVLEWAIIDPNLFENICPIACNAKHSPWGIAFNEAQRMALEADQTLWKDDDPQAGRAGLEAARAMALISYRNYPTFSMTQKDDSDKLEGFRAQSYQRYQGLKLSKRFTALAYLSLTKSMDSHNVGRDRVDCQTALKAIKAKTLVIGIESDILFPINEQRFLAQEIPFAQLEIIDSPYGHDGFLIEYEAMNKLLENFLKPVKKVSLGVKKSEFRAKNVS